MGVYGKIIDLQKMQDAWKKVYKNKPAAGIDGITYDDFNNRSKEEIKQLNIELVEHRYVPRPVKLVNLYKEDKVRVIALFCMRDKIVQQSVAIELGRIYDSSLSECTYAYRPNRSALIALEKIENAVKGVDNKYVLKMDIRHFFDEIDHKKLREILAERIKEEDVLELIEGSVKTGVLSGDDGEIRPNQKGVHQGSGCAPILSNIYLMHYDRYMQEHAEFFVRYSDDMIVIDSSREHCIELLEYTKQYMNSLMLSLHEDKTGIYKMEEGFDYLGYHFDTTGKSIPSKAETSLQDRLESMWLTSGEGIKDKLHKGQEMLGGWEQYYRENREAGSIIEYVVLVSMLGRADEIYRKHIEDNRLKYINYYKDVTIYLADYWKSRNRIRDELKEYEQFYQLPDIEHTDHYEREDLMRELVSDYEKVIACTTKDTLEDIMQLYSEIGDYNKAAAISDMIIKETKEDKKAVSVNAQIPTIQSSEEAKTPKVNHDDYYKLFIGREDTYGKEIIDGTGRRKVEQAMEPLADEVLTKHLNGHMMIATYVMRPNSTAKYLVYDIDVSKKILLAHPYGSEKFISYKQLALETSVNIMNILKKNGVKAYLEDTGHRGYHVWVFFTEWIPIRFVNMFSEYVLEQLGLADGTDVSVETFPNKTRIREGKTGPCIHIPLGVHPVTGVRSVFLDEDMTPVDDYVDYFSGISKISLPAVRKILGTYAMTEKKTEPSRIVDEDLSAYGNIPDSVKTVLDGCNLMRYLCQKSRTTGYLSHFERLSVLYVFGHLGDEGKDFVHTIMEYTINYKYDVTQKFINKIPDKPISCLKLRDQYKQLTAEYGCSCNFKRTKNCYPSPVLHALKNADMETNKVTIPTSRTITKTKSDEVYEEINIHKQAEQCASRILELRKQQRGIDKTVHKVESELETLFNNAGIDCLEVEMGMLTRRKRAEGGYDWVIEI